MTQPDQEKVEQEYEKIFISISKKMMDVIGKEKKNELMIIFNSTITSLTKFFNDQGTPETQRDMFMSKFIEIFPVYFLNQLFELDDN